MPKGRKKKVAYPSHPFVSLGKWRRENGLVSKEWEWYKKSAWLQDIVLIGGLIILYLFLISLQATTIRDLSSDVCNMAGLSYSIVDDNIACCNFALIPLHLEGESYNSRYIISLGHGMCTDIDDVLHAVSWFYE